MNSIKTVLLLCSMAVTVAACAAKRPVLYPNDYLVQVGDAAAQGAIDECMRLASEYGAEESKGAEIARETAESAAVGGAAGAAAGAVLGNVGRGAGAGAAGAGAATLTRGLFRSRDPGPIYRAFVERCLRERGYEPIGWR